MKHLFYLLFFILLSNFVFAQSTSFADYCKSKILKDSVKMSLMYGNINVGRNYKYHIVQFQRPNLMYKTTYYYPLLEKGLNKDVYRTYSIDVRNVAGNTPYRDSFNPYSSRNFSAAVVNGLWGMFFKQSQ